MTLVRRFPVVVGLALISAFAILDRTSGVEITFVVLTYLLPIAIVTWFRSRAIAFVMAALATFCTTVILAEAEPTPAAVLNALGAFAMYATFIAVLHALREHVERERRQRRAAIEQLRHAERLNVIGTLAAGVAHELGTPLNVISGAAEMLAEGEPTRERVDQLSALILRQTQQVTAIIRHLLDFGRRAGTSTSRVDLDNGVASAIELLAATARKNDVTMRFSAGIGTSHPVRANMRELEQVVSNLIINGIQAMPRGGALDVSTRLEVRRDTTYGVVVVKDEGAGIRPEHLPFIFDPFFTTKGVGEGTGLGLSVSYGIVSDWGGALEVASAVGTGSTFTVLVPLMRDAAVSHHHVAEA